jgi:oligopeptide/dipeptide ABC transporter ATP-binding protein
MGLMGEPSLILADEPTTALDVTVQAQILDLLREVNRTHGTAVVLISHDVGVVADFCSRIVVMYAGRIVEDADVATLLQAPAHPYTRALFAAVPDLTTPVDEPLETIPGRPPSLDDLPPGCPFAPRCPHVFDRCLVERPPAFPLSHDRRASCFLVEPGHERPMATSGTMPALPKPADA